MTNKPSPQDIYDIDKKTGALILGSNRLDDYATKYLSEHCKDALEQPMALPVESILEKEGLSIIKETLSSTGDIFGCCLLLGGTIPVYDKQSSSIKEKYFLEGTILIDPNSEARLGEGALRNTLMHEAIHWEKDRRYFQIKALMDGAASTQTAPLLCRTSESFREPPSKPNAKNQLRWIEWQAHRLAPRILMPRKPFKAKASELIQCAKRADGSWRPDACDFVVESLSEFFIVSRVSVKYRLKEVGLEGSLSALPDYAAVYESVNNKDSYTSLSPIEAMSFIEKNPLLASWISDRKFVFADGYFVLADPKYVEYKNGALHLKKTARNNLKKCAININSYSYRSYKNFDKDLSGLSCLLRTTDIDQRLLTFHPEYQPDFTLSPDDAYSAFANQLFDCEDDIEFLELLSSPSTTLCDCLKYLLEAKGIVYPAQFEDATLLNKNYLGKIKKNEYNKMGSAILMALCVGLGLGLRTVQKLFDKSSTKLDEFNNPDKTWIKVLESMPGLPIADFNSVLASRGLDELGSTVKD